MIIVDKNLCIGCGACEVICPKVFKINQEAKSEAISQKNCDCVKDAIEGCPAQAISVS